MNERAGTGESGDVRLRDVEDDDLETFFVHQQDEVAGRMAAFTAEDPSDRAGFDAHWERIRAEPTIVTRTILVDRRVAGHIASFLRDGDLEVTYWLGREHWGRGVATRALARFLGEVTARPIHARVAKDNPGSLRVLEKCGFTIIGEERGFANARGEEIDELVLVSHARPPA